MLTPGLFDIRFREQFDLLSSLKLSGRPSERQADYHHAQSWRAAQRASGEDNCPPIMMTIRELLIRSLSV